MDKDNILKRITMETESQKSMILRYLRKYGHITPKEARMNFGCDRLGARIYNLKKEGHKIETRMIQVADRKRVAQYHLKREK
jgi:hypothetical protein